MRRLAFALCLLAGLAAGGCTSLWSDQPLSPPGSGTFDPRLLGNWYALQPPTEGIYLYLHLAATSGDRVDFFGLQAGNNSDNVLWCRGTAWPTIIAGQAYFSLELAGCANVDGRAPERFPGYFLAMTTLGGDDRLTVRILDMDRLLALEQAGELRLRKVSNGRWLSDIFIETPGPDLAALIQRLGPDRLFGPDLTFRRL